MSRATKSSAIIKKYAIASGGAGLIGAPLLATTALTGLHFALIRELSHLYGVEFSKEAARGILLALGAAFLPGLVGGSLQRSILSRLPLLTGALGWMVMAGFSAAVTHALGKTMVEHFDAGGNLKDFDLSKLHHAWLRYFRSHKPARIEAPAA